MSFTVTTLSSSQLVTFHNSPNSRARETIDARLINSNFASYLTTLNTLITETIAEDASNVKLTGNQTVAGVKTFTDGISTGITDEFLIINSDLTTAEVDAGIRINRGSTSGTDAELRWVAADDVFKFTIDSGTTPVRVQIAAGTTATDAVRFDQTLLTTGNQTKASGILTFNVLPQSTVVPGSGPDFTNKTYVDLQVFGNMGIVQSAGAPAATAGQLWADISTSTAPLLKRGNGATFDTFTTNTLPLNTTLTADFTVTGTRLLDFGTNRLRNIGTSVLASDTVRQDEVIRTTGSQSKSGILTFTTLPESSVVPITGNQLVNKTYADSTSNLTFNPLYIDGLTLWLDADDITGLTDGASVTTWSDSSGSKYDFTQATAARKPIYKTSIINSKPVVRFDGTDDRLTNATAKSNFITSTAYTMFIVFNAAAISTNNATIPDNVAIFSDSGEIWGLFLRSAPSANHYINDGAGKNLATTIATATNYIFTLRKDSTNHYSQLNNAAETSVASGTMASMVETLNIGMDTDALAFFNGDIAEIILYNKDLSSSERVRIRNYLNTKYAIF